MVVVESKMRKLFLRRRGILLSLPPRILRMPGYILIFSNEWIGIFHIYYFIQNIHDNFTIIQNLLDRCNLKQLPIQSLDKGGGRR